MTDSEQTTLERKKTLNKAIATANKRKQRANLTAKQKELQKSKDRKRKRKMRENELPEEKVIRRIANKFSARKARARESPEKRAAKNEAMRVAMRLKKKGETKEEAKLRRRRNLWAVYRQQVNWRHAYNQRMEEMEEWEQLSRPKPKSRFWPHVLSIKSSF